MYVPRPQLGQPKDRPHDLIRWTIAELNADDRDRRTGSHGEPVQTACLLAGRLAVWLSGDDSPNAPPLGFAMGCNTNPGEACPVSDLYQQLDIHWVPHWVLPTLTDPFLISDHTRYPSKLDQK